MSVRDQNPELTAAHDDGDYTEATPSRSLTSFNGLAIVVGLQIGSGIFSTPASVATLVPSPVLGVCVWAFAGLFVWTGAASFAELGVRCPDNGGIQEYLCHSLGDLYGFLFAYVWILIIKPCAMSMIALIFAEYLYRGFAIDHADMSLWGLKGLALLAISLVTYLNCMGTGKAASTANIFLLLKLATLGTIASLGFVAGSTGLKYSTSTQQQQHLGSRSLMTDSHKFNSTSTPQSSLYKDFSSTTEAVLAALFAFGGWESIGFVAGEILDPVENLPRILNSAMLIVITLFILTVAAFYTVLPLEKMQDTNAIAIVGSCHAVPLMPWLIRTGFRRRALRKGRRNLLYMDGLLVLSRSPQCDGLLSWAPDESSQCKTFCTFFYHSRHEPLQGKSVKSDSSKKNFGTDTPICSPSPPVQGP